MSLKYAIVLCFTSIHFVSSAVLEQFETVDQAVDFIASAPRLEDIVFESIVCSESCHYSSQAIAPPLRQIRCDADPLVVDTIMDWFCRCHTKSVVKTMDIYGFQRNFNVSTVCKFIRHQGSALMDLMISCSNFKVLSKCISDPYSIDASLINSISCSGRTRSIPEYFSSLYHL